MEVLDGSGGRAGRGCGGRRVSGSGVEKPVIREMQGWGLVACLPFFPLLCFYPSGVENFEGLDP